MARRECVRIAETNKGGGKLGCLLVVLLVLWGIVGNGLRLAVAELTAEGMGLSEALWAAPARFLTLATAVLSVLALLVLAKVVIGLPRSLARDEVCMSEEGMEFVTRPLWWYRGARELVRWHNVQLVRASWARFVKSVGYHTRAAVERPVIEVLLFHRPKTMPDFVVQTTVESDPLAEVRTPATSIQIGGAHVSSQALERLAAAVDTLRPGALHRDPESPLWYQPHPPEQDT
jgi:hypothetical protein